MMALTCRSEGGPKEEDLKAMYAACLKKQDGGNSSDTGYQDEQDWRGSRGRFNQRNHWNRGGTEDRGDREDREDRTRNRGNRARGRDNNMDSNDRRTGNRDERRNRDRKRIGERDDGNSGRDERSSHEYTDNKRHKIGRKDDFGDDLFDEIYNFPKNHDFERGIPRFNGFHSTTQPSRRFRRSRRTQNSGQRSQYNPNTRKQSENDDSYDEEDKNSSSNTDMDSKACALHCFLEELEMTDEEGMPDRYLVTDVITKDVRNEDLRDFLQESIEECFQILDNEKTEDKCEFSKMLMMCLSEKGKANCDDWNENLKI
ncbi:unnamed protein product [Diatraea saccharalis]|uniref:Uncharacterized protein n=1 Tax=Diatraea saccharalis TaxID=40085 RepID=A0A9N9R034_9NEOP|nr:unnamed protein product [Diatraea saccharalis]